MAPTDTVWKNDKARLPVNLLGMTPVSAQFAAICDISIGYMLHRCPAVCVCPGRAVNGHVFPQDRRDFPSPRRRRASAACCGPSSVPQRRLGTAVRYAPLGIGGARLTVRKTKSQPVIKFQPAIFPRPAACALGAPFFDLRLCRFMA